MENFRNIINRLNNKIQYLEDENKALREQHEQELQKWQIVCSRLEDELFELIETQEEAAA